MSMLFEDCALNISPMGCRRTNMGIEQASASFNNIIRVVRDQSVKKKKITGTYYYCYYMQGCVIYWLTRFSYGFDAGKRSLHASV